MKRAFFIFVLLLSLTFFFSTQSYAVGDWTGNANFSIGNKVLDKDDWAVDEEGFKLELDTQREVALNVDFGEKTWPIHIVIAYLGSSADDSMSEDVDIDGYAYTGKLTFKGSTGELRLGINKIWEPTSTIRPYIGGGFAMISAEAKITASIAGVSASESDDDQAVGFYVNGGIYWTLAEHYNLGIDVGYSKAKVTFDKLYTDVEAGGAHYGVFLGYHW